MQDSNNNVFIFAKTETGYISVIKTKSRIKIHHNIICLQLFLKGKILKQRETSQHKLLFRFYLDLIAWQYQTSLVKSPLTILDVIMTRRFKLNLVTFTSDWTFFRAHYGHEPLTYYIIAIHSCVTNVWVLLFLIEIQKGSYDAKTIIKCYFHTHTLLVLIKNPIKLDVIEYIHFYPQLQKEASIKNCQTSYMLF